MSGYSQPQHQSTATAGTLQTPEGAPMLRHRISWGAILAGALVAIAVGATLNVLGLAVGVTMVDAQARDTPSATTLGIAGSVWILVSNLLGLALGGYVAARLSGTSDGHDATLHGAAVWATAFLISGLVLGSMASGAARTATNAISGAMGGLGQAAGQAAQAVAPQMDTDALTERARLTLSGSSDPARMTPEQRGAEISSLIVVRVTDGNLSEADRRRLNQLVAAEAGIPEQEAATRVQAYEADAQRMAQETERRAREAADAAAKAAAMASYWIFGTLVLGAIAAIIGARTGTRDLVYLDSRRTVT
ncbi:hypothetical protein [Roseomonas xinghualingensis]|uniref:hypothetical protein n=1 Tax=Roseomonas xinghualingensis TaxID=2986475 RepID=UPI0021F219FD|nr:hypothetical protein [Roseomonas sp. SXEYE001]MCV4207487.1 hypothetical protein [Roseomonas sp. SXEYE001]